MIGPQTAAFLEFTWEQLHRDRLHLQARIMMLLVAESGPLDRVQLDDGKGPITVEMNVHAAIKDLGPDATVEDVMQLLDRWRRRP